MKYAKLDVKNTKSEVLSAALQLLDPAIGAVREGDLLPVAAQAEAGDTQSAATSDLPQT